MPHRALTLKYRPQVFADLVGQEHVSTVLGRAIESGRIAHAYLFTGARGVGKTTSARILAKALNCSQREAGRGAEPCGACASCQEITTGVSLDVIEIDGASNRGIADVQALRESVRFAPTGGRYRVVIIDEVHQLSSDAFAALLKTLEEPPAHLIFIFATTDPQKLPDTIRSRTQRFDFARVPLRKVADRLHDIQKREAADADGVRFALSDGAALLIAHKGEGSMRDSVSALDQVVSAGEAEIDEALVRRVLGIADREAFFAIGEAVTSRDPRRTLQELHHAFERGLDPRDLAEGLAEHFRQLLVVKVDPERGGELIASTREDLTRLAAQGADWSENDLLRLMRIAAECQWPMRDSPQPLIHLEAAVMQMATLEPAETLAILLERLEALEQRLAGGSAAGPPAGGGRAPSTSSASPAATPRATGGSTVRRAASDTWSRPSAPVVPPGRFERGAPPGSATATTPPMSMRAPVATAEAQSVAVLAGDAEPEFDEVQAGLWRQTISAVNARKRMLGAFLEESRFVGIAADRVVLAMDDLHRAVVDVQEHRQMVAEELRQVFGRPLQVRCVPLGAADLPKRPSVDDVKPLIERAIQVLDGEVIERVDRGGELPG